MKKLSLILVVASSLLFTQCEVLREGCTDPSATNYSVAADVSDNSCIYDEGCTNPRASNYNPNAVLDDGSCRYDSLSLGGNCQAHLEGNLSVTNNTGTELFLFNNYSYISCIPANAENFILNIPNQNNDIIVLQVWKANEVGDVNDPNKTNVYRQWSVALSNTTLENERANWLITNSDKDKSSGTLLLSYPEFDDYNQKVIYQVDVYLNSKTGAKLASLQPGVTDKKVSVDYGVTYLYFRYWYSDPDSPSSEITEIGWNEKGNIVINAQHQSEKIDIPIFYSIVGKYAYLKVKNSTNNLISIYANGKLIEKIAKVDGSPDGLSIIPANNATTFLIPEETYTITAKSLDGSTTIISFKNVNVTQTDTAVVNVGIKHKEISITNNTTEVLMVYSEAGIYLGKTINPGKSTGIYLVDNKYDSLLIKTPNDSKKKTVPATTGVVIENLDDFVTMNLDITNSWTSIGSNHYQSPDIGSSQSTTMSAKLFNQSTVLLSFEYKVSSEYDYDIFSFSIDGTTKIEKESGETDWKTYSVNISSGYHTLNWTYTKDGMFDVGNDNVEIRNLAVK